MLVYKKNNTFCSVLSDDEEDATHIIYPAVDPLEEEYARPIFRRGNHVLVHWYYFPDSHDTWAQADLPVSGYFMRMTLAPGNDLLQFNVSLVNMDENISFHFF